jgi:hypothetical protein
MPAGARSGNGCLPPAGCAPACGGARLAGSDAASRTAALTATGCCCEAVKRKAPMAATNPSAADAEAPVRATIRDNYGIEMIERWATNYLGFINLACSVILLRHL